jgi:hypothetical protein
VDYRCRSSCSAGDLNTIVRAGATEDPSHAHKPTFTAAQSPEEQAAKPPTYTVLHAFTGGTDGSLPFVSGLDVGLIRDKKGNL